MSDTRIIVLLLLAAVALWYFLGAETCEGCIHECQLVHGKHGAVDCANLCAKKGLDCAMDLAQPTLDVIDVQCRDCVGKCTSHGGKDAVECKKACEIAGQCPMDVSASKARAEAQARAQAEAAAHAREQQEAQQREHSAGAYSHSQFAAGSAFAAPGGGAPYEG